MLMGEVGKLKTMVGKFEIGKTVHSGKLSRERDGLERCSREKDVAPGAKLTARMLVGLLRYPLRMHVFRRMIATHRSRSQSCFQILI